jgi:hypothetical protein
LRTLKFSVEVSTFVLLFILVGGVYSTGASAKSNFCQKEYARINKIKVRHRAVATTLGLPLSAQDIACGFSGQDTKQKAISGALNGCKRSAKKNGNPGKCVIIEIK